MISFQTTKQMQQETIEIHTQFCQLHYEVYKIKKMDPFDEKMLEDYKNDSKLMEMKMTIGLYKNIIEENKKRYIIIQRNMELPPMRIRLF